MSFWRESEHKARKVHGCDWCNNLIMAGELYYYGVGVVEGDFNTLKYHLKCNKQVKVTLATQDESTYDIDELRDIYNENQLMKESDR